MLAAEAEAGVPTPSADATMGDTVNWLKTVKQLAASNQQGQKASRSRSKWPDGWTIQKTLWNWKTQKYLSGETENGQMTLNIKVEIS